MNRQKTYETRANKWSLVAMLALATAAPGLFGIVAGLAYQEWVLALWGMLTATGCVWAARNARLQSFYWTSRAMHEMATTDWEEELKGDFH